MIELNMNSRLVRWTYFPERLVGDHIPTHTSLCLFFWRTVLVTPIFGSAYWFFRIVTYPFLLLWYIIRWAAAMTRLEGKLDKVVDGLIDGPIGVGVAALHKRICPIIRIQ